MCGCMFKYGQGINRHETICKKKFNNKEDLICEKEPIFKWFRFSDLEKVFEEKVLGTKK